MTRQAAHVFIVAATLLTRETIVTSLNKQNTKWCLKILLKCEKTNKAFKLGATGESNFFKKASKL